MKHWLAAVAAAPLMVACASAGAAETRYAAADADGQSVLIVNGQRIIIRDGEDAVRVIRTQLGANPGDDVEIDFDLDFDNSAWSEAEQNAFEEEMERLAADLVAAFADTSAFEIEINGDRLDEAELEQRIEIIVAQAEQHAERAAHRAEREAERAARHAERQAERAARRAEREAARAERMAVRVSLNADSIAAMGLRAAETGMQAGLRAIDRTLERGYTEEDGERRPLTASEIEELTEARDELHAELDALRAEMSDHTLDELIAEHAPHHSRDDQGSRSVRVVERDGVTRVWINGRELEGDALEAWLESDAAGLAGAPGAPKSPRPPRPVQR